MISSLNTENLSQEISTTAYNAPSRAATSTQSRAGLITAYHATNDLTLLQSASASASRHTAAALNEAIRSIETRLQVN